MLDVWLYVPSIHKETHWMPSPLFKPETHVHEYRTKNIILIILTQKKKKKNVGNDYMIDRAYRKSRVVQSFSHSS